MCIRDSCCADFDGKTILGNLNTETIAEVWNSDAFRAVRREHLESGGPDVCRSCDLPRKDSPLWITKLAHGGGPAVEVDPTS